MSGGVSPSAVTLAATRDVARLRPGVSPADLAASYQTDALDFIPEIRVVLLRSPTGVSAGTFAQRLASDSRVEFAEPDLPVRSTETRQSSIAFSEGVLPWSAVLDQGALRRVGAAQAQAVTRGANVLVAILDTGIELDHPALVGSIQLPGIEPGVVTNPGDDRAQGVDTNGDGLVDGALGHGTHVAGIVHALAPDAGLLAVRVLDSDGVGDAFALARGLVAATNRGASVANLSLGMDQPSQSVASAIDFARGHGMLIAAAAGNAAKSTSEFPGSDAPVLSVAATDSLDERAVFSNYGAGVDLAAPGVGILSTFVGGGYAAWSGTSMAAPFVSGAGALVFALTTERGPTTEAEVEAALQSGAQPLTATDPAFGSMLGSGRIDAARSVTAFLRVQGDPSGTNDALLRPNP